MKRERRPGDTARRTVYPIYVGSATLGKFLPESTGEMQPPWAERNFSFRFSGQVPLESYPSYLLEGE